MRQQILLCGVGGQGIVLMSKIIGESAILLDLPVISSETHGMAQRGGIVTAHVKVGGFAGPIISVGDADLIFVLKEETLEQFRHFVKPDGFIIVNSDRQYDDRVISFDADGLVKRLNQLKATNIAMIGAIFSQKALSRGLRFFCTAKEIERAMIQYFARKEELLEKSLMVFKKSITEL